MPTASRRLAPASTVLKSAQTSLNHFILIELLYYLFITAGFCCEMWMADDTVKSVCALKPGIWCLVTVVLTFYATNTTFSYLRGTRKHEPRPKQLFTLKLFCFGDSLTQVSCTKWRIHWSIPNKFLNVLFKQNITYLEGEFSSLPQKSFYMFLWQMLMSSIYILLIF